MMDLPLKHFGVVYADPPWRWEAWSEEGEDRSASQHYPTMTLEDMMALPIAELCLDDVVLLMWIIWPMLPEALELIKAWGFKYKTGGFDWMKADNSQPDFFQEDLPAQVGMGYWTRSNTEPCLLATRGHPKRLNADVRQGIISPRRQHSRKPNGMHERIERLVAGPYLELFARQSTRPGWTFWGNQKDKFNRDNFKF